jgi:hypothetical protein
MTHGSQVIDLGGLDVVDDRDEVGSIAQISIMQENLDSGFVAILVNVINASSIEATRTTDYSVDLREREV